MFSGYVSDCNKEMLCWLFLCHMNYKRQSRGNHFNKDKHMGEKTNAFVSMFAERCIYSVDGDFTQLERIKKKDARSIQVSRLELKYGGSTIRSRVKR